MRNKKLMILGLIICLVFSGCGKKEVVDKAALAPNVTENDTYEEETSMQEDTAVTEDEPASTEDAVSPVEGFTYEEIENGVRITGYDEQYGSEVTVPSEIDGNEVIEIGEKAFASSNEIVSISLPDTVTVIEDYAFAWCESLEEVTLSEGLYSIGESAFLCDYELSDIVIPEGVTKIEAYTFSVCKDLKTITIPDSVTTIGVQAFNECGSLGDVTLSANVTDIAEDAFIGCDNLALYTVLGSYADDYATEHVIFHIGTDN